MHRLLALLTVLTLGGLCAALWRSQAFPFLSRALLGVLLLQLATGISNVVLDWPLPAAVLHTGGAGALVVILVALLCSTATSNRRLNP